MPRTREFLTSGERSLLSKPEELQKMSPQRRGTLFRDVRLKAIRMIEALTFLSNHLPEKQAAKIFRPDIEEEKKAKKTRNKQDEVPRLDLLIDGILRTKRRYQLAQLLADKSLRLLETQIPFKKDTENNYIADTMLKDSIRARLLIRQLVKDSEPKKK